MIVASLRGSLGLRVTDSSATFDWASRGTCRHNVLFACSWSKECAKQSFGALDFSRLSHQVPPLLFSSPDNTLICAQVIHICDKSIPSGFHTADDLVVSCASYRQSNPQTVGNWPMLKVWDRLVKAYFWRVKVDNWDHLDKIQACNFHRSSLVRSHACHAKTSTHLCQVCRSHAHNTDMALTFCLNWDPLSSGVCKHTILGCGNDHFVDRIYKLVFCLLHIYANTHMHLPSYRLIWANARILSTWSFHD